MFADEGTCMKMNPKTQVIQKVKAIALRKPSTLKKGESKEWKNFFEMCDKVDFVVSSDFGCVYWEDKIRVEIEINQANQ